MTFTQQVTAAYADLAVTQVEAHLARGWSMHDAIGSVGIHQARIYAESRGVAVRKSWPLYKIAEALA